MTAWQWATYLWELTVFRVRLEARTTIFWLALLCAALGGIAFAIVLAGGHL